MNKVRVLSLLLLAALLAVGSAGCARVTAHRVVPQLSLGEPSFFPTIEAYSNAPIVGDIAEALAERCRAGVGVNVLLDAVGSFYIPGDYVDLMRTSGCQVA